MPKRLRMERRFSTNPRFPQALDTGASAGVYSAAAAMPPLEEPAVSVAKLVCVECDRTWDDPRERWRVKALFDEREAELVPYCPACHAREFD
jgi:hypothetical protein